MAAHDAAHVVTAGVQPGDGKAPGIEHPRSAVGPQAGEGSQAAWHHPHGVVRTPCQGRHARVGQPARRVALDAVVGRFALREIRVLATPGHLVVVRDGSFQPVRLDVAESGQFGGRASAQQVAPGQRVTQGHRGWLDSSKAVAAQEGMVTNEPGLHRLAGGNGTQEALQEVMVGVGFVGEAPPIARDGNQPGLGTLQQVRKVRLRAVGPGHQ